jgi:LysE type translocator
LPPRAAPHRRPRANLLYILGNGVGAGYRSAIAAAVGVECGTLVHLAAAVVGLSAALRSSALAFTTVNDLGVGYLVHLAIKAFRTSQGGHRKPATTPSRFRPAFLQGVAVNLLNPKVSLFSWRSCRSSSTPAAGHPPPSSRRSASSAWRSRSPSTCSTRRSPAGSAPGCRVGPPWPGAKAASPAPSTSALPPSP